MKEKELPEGWKNVKFFDFCELQRGYDLQIAHSIEGSFPIVTSAGIAGYHNEYKSLGPGVCSGRSGSIGNVFYIEENFWPHNTSLFVKNFKGNLPKYVYYFLRYFNPSKYSASTAVPTMNRNLLRNIEVIVPPLPVQRQIVAVLEQAEALKRQRREADALAGALLQSVFYEMFGDPVRNENGWAVKRLGDLTLKFLNGGTPSTALTEFWGGSIPWTTSKLLTSCSIDAGEKFISQEAIEKSSSNVIPKDNVLIASRVGIGKSAVNSIDIAISQDLTGVILDKKQIIPIFLVYFLHTQILLRTLESNARGSTIKGLQRSDLERIEIPLPPLALQQQFAHVVEEVERIRERQAASGKEIEALCGGLMQRAFGGELVA